MDSKKNSSDTEILSGREKIRDLHKERNGGNASKEVYKALNSTGTQWL